MDLQSIFKGEDVTVFLKKAFQLIKTNKIEVDHFYLDHLCYRTESFENYKAIVEKLKPMSRLVSDKEYNGRPIAVVRLNEPIRFDGRRISLLEIPAPKPGKSYKEGWQHIEFTVNLQLKEFLKFYPNINFDKSKLEDKLYPEVSVSFENIEVIFNYFALERKIMFEEVLGDSNIPKPPEKEE